MTNGFLRQNAIRANAGAVLISHIYPNYPNFVIPVIRFRSRARFYGN